MSLHPPTPGFPSKQASPGSRRLLSEGHLQPSHPGYCRHSGLACPTAPATIGPTVGSRCARCPGGSSWTLKSPREPQHTEWAPHHLRAGPHPGTRLPMQRVPVGQCSHLGRGWPRGRSSRSADSGGPP